MIGRIVDVVRSISGELRQAESDSSRARRATSASGKDGLGLALELVPHAGQKTTARPTTSLEELRILDEDILNGRISYKMSIRVVCRRVSAMTV